MAIFHCYVSSPEGSHLCGESGDQHPDSPPAQTAQWMLDPKNLNLNRWCHGQAGCRNSQWFQWRMETFEWFQTIIRNDGQSMTFDIYPWSSLIIVDKFKKTKTASEFLVDPALESHSKTFSRHHWLLFRRHLGNALHDFALTLDQLILWFLYDVKT